MLFFAGCTLGYRYHQVEDSAQSRAGMSGQISGQGHTVELGVVLDFRYMRLILPYLGADYELELSASDGGKATQSTLTEKRGLRLDLPVLSLWEAKSGWDLGYPGVMPHRESVELWLSATGRMTRPLLGYADLGLVYYHHNLVALRAFGGWGVAPFEETSSRFGADGMQYERWEHAAGGFSGGVEITLGAGEQALDFLMFFMDTQDAIADDAGR